jgi:RND superfamily putative drug exporter
MGEFMLQTVAKLAIARPRKIIAAALLILFGAAMFGLPVVKSLPSSGFRDPDSESWHASQLLSDKFGRGDMQLVRPFLAVLAR